MIFLVIHCLIAFSREKINTLPSPRRSPLSRPRIRSSWMGIDYGLIVLSGL
jgi:hypothetical protein